MIDTVWRWKCRRSEKKGTGADNSGELTRKFVTSPDLLAWDDGPSSNPIYMYNELLWKPIAWNDVDYQEKSWAIGVKSSYIIYWNTVQVGGTFLYLLITHLIFSVNGLFFFFFRNYDIVDLVGSSVNTTEVPWARWTQRAHTPAHIQSLTLHPQCTIINLQP